MITVPLGTPKTCSPLTAFGWSGVNSPSLVGVGPAIRLPFLSNRYHSLAPFALTSDWTGFSRRYRELNGIGLPCVSTDGLVQVLLEVVQLELRRLPDDLRRRPRIVDPGELDDDLVRLLLADLGLAHAQGVDARTA